MLKLSILDQSPIASGATPAQALGESVRLAELADRLGYHRYWSAEHHGSDGFASGCPEVLIGHIANATQRIRVGAGGVMLMHYSPYKVAETFKVLGTLHPGRIDLGIGRAPGGDGIAAAALAYGSAVGVEYLPLKVADLKAFVRDEPPLTEALEKAKPLPRVDVPPELWLLGSSVPSAQFAAELGMGYSYAHFFNPGAALEACKAYRDHFVPSAVDPEPKLMVGVFVLCADTEEHAEKLALCRDLWVVRSQRGETQAFPSIEEAEAHPWTQAERDTAATHRAAQILGTPETVATRLRQLGGDCGADEIIVLSTTHEFEDRARSYELLARELLQQD